MQSYLIVSNNQRNTDSYIKTLLNEFKIGNFDIYTLLPSSKKEGGEKSIGIEDIRIFKKKLFLKPLNSLNKALIIKSAENLTLEAQNALLKSLEEPPANTIIILSVSNEESLLPTILSRCRIIKLLEDKEIDEKDEEISKTIESIFKLEVGERLKLAENLSKNKEDTYIILEKFIVVTRKKLLEEIEKQEEKNINNLLNFLKSLNKIYAIIKNTNVNSRLTLENFFLSL